MQRLLAFSLLALVALPAQAQFRPFDDPTVWVAVSTGMMWQTAGAEPRQDQLASDFHAAVASSPWMLRAGLQISNSFDIPITLGSLEGRSASPSGRQDDLEYSDFDPITFRTVYAVGGAFATSRWFMGGASVGPALTWGTQRRSLVGPCPSDGCTFDILRDEEAYVLPGIAGGAQGFVRLDGRVWVGGETMLVANLSHTHVATRLALRVDLLRPDR